MSIFTEREQIAAMEETIKEKLRRNGLNHLSVKVTRKTGSDVKITLDGGSESDIKRAGEILGSTPTITKPGSISSPKITLPKINSKGQIVESQIKTSSRYRSK